MGSCTFSPEIQMALFSLVYVVGVQLALYNFLTTIGIPFFHLQLRFGLGFVYDLVSCTLFSP